LARKLNSGGGGMHFMVSAPESRREANSSTARK
jgi:hypothetical protein